ncbi:LysR family transcriptional regulator [Sediminicurvatus halobius]|uniref:HTH lysR-type domain-containing protein n=1 Tax=Sediminicurvatus halobius TaxID=2182432 RepID=A0A2U2N690_9GAMM|nr:LysR family transcriptional regulator [Spiribacter halobius]PWG64650.1 hypothetical protein DEM34_04805 [Spiribacter halobius]
MNLNFNQLRSFLLVAEEGNLTRAAARRHSTPSAVTAHLQQLEARLGVVLFERGHSGMRLTEAGEHLLPAARRVLAAARELADAAATLTGDNATRSISLGLNAPPEHLHVGRIMTVGARGTPPLVIHLESSMSERIIADVAAGRLDAGFAYGAVEEPALAREPLGQRRLRIAAPAGYPIEHFPDDPAERAALPWIWPGVAGCPFRRLMPEILGASAADANIINRVDGEESIRALVRAGMGFGLLEERYAQEAADDGGLKLLAPAWEIPLGLVYRADRAAEPGIAALRAAVREAWQQVSEGEDEARAPASWQIRA